MSKLDNFYSYNSLESWIKFLGDKLHYHFGVFTEPNNDPFDQAVIELFKYIPEKSKILDCGCGWGGPGKLLKEKLNCDITGITISKTQSEFIKDFPVIHADLNYFILDKEYDIAIFIESFTHIVNPYKVLLNFKNYVKSIVIKDYISETRNSIPSWNMYIRNKDTYHKIIENAGYEIKEFKIHYSFSKESLKIWRNNLKKLKPEEITGQLKLLEMFCENEDLDHLDIQQCTIYAIRK
jgi:hypothetical protein